MKIDNMDIALYEIYLEDRGIAESTRSAYTGVITKFLIGNPNLETPDDYIEFVVRTAIKKRCYHNMYAIIHFIKYKLDNENKALANEIISKIRERNVQLKMPIKYKDIRPLSEKEMEKMINNLQSEKHRILAYIMYATGIRAGDALRISKTGMYWEDYKDNRVLKLSLTSKGDDVRSIWIFNPVVAEMIFTFINEHDYDNSYAFIEKRKVVHGMTNLNTEFKLRAYNYQLLWCDLKEALVKSKIERNRFASHGFRRNLAKREYELHHDIYKLQKILGHKDVNTTARYLAEQGFEVKDSLMELQLGN